MGLNLKAFVSLDGSGFETGIRRIQGVVGGIQSQIAGAFSIGAIAALTKKTIDYAGHVNDLSDRLGVSTDFLQEFQFVAKQSGADLDDLTTVMEKLRDARDTALGGGQAAAKPLAQFAAFGVTEQQLRSARLEDLISGPIAAAFQSGDVQGKLGAAWRDLGGRGAGQLVAGFTGGFNEGREAAHRAGAVMSNDIVQQLDYLGDRFTILGQIMMATVGGAIISLVNSLRTSFNFIQGAVQAFIAFFGRAFRGFSFGNALDAANTVMEENFARFMVQLSEEEQARQERENARRNRAAAPTAPSFDQTGTAARQGTGRELPSDSLTRIGNFLGSGRNTMTVLAERQVSLLQQIVVNTRPRPVMNNGTNFPTV